MSYVRGINKKLDDDNKEQKSNEIDLNLLAVERTEESNMIPPLHTSTTNVIELTSSTAAFTNTSFQSPELEYPVTSHTPKNTALKRHQNLSLQILPSPAKEKIPENTETSTNVSTSTPTSSSAVFCTEKYKTLRKLDIGFKNIEYTVTSGLFKKESKTILKGLNGEFRAGELSAIVGPSGTGKSTLLNILSGYTDSGYTGQLTVNGKVRDTKSFKPNVAFIMQDTSLQPFLSVKEAMHFAANLKLGFDMTAQEKRERVKNILEAIGMFENRHTRTENLSGGQSKRLAIALELVDNPPVLILDEPTSGLDSCIANQCISLLKKLAIEGRTVICTIHQPSALSFDMFDHLYAIGEGECIFSGGTQNLVPFLAELELHCPESYNPADYLMEIATHDYGKQNHRLVAKIKNGCNDAYRQGRAAWKMQMEAMRKVDKMMSSGLITPVTAPLMSPTLPSSLYHSFNVCSHHSKQQLQSPLKLAPINELSSSKVWASSHILSDREQSTVQNQLEHSDCVCCKHKKPKISIDTPQLCTRKNIYATPFYHQLYILLIRTFLVLWRDSSLTTMRFVIHFLTALLIGFLYYGIGNDAGNALNNFRYVFYTIMFIMYCAFSSILVKFPLEFPIVSREHFNRWYSLRAYYTAITLADIPIQVICTSLFILTSYVMTEQPLDLIRLSLFSFIIFLTALVGQSIGLAVGASLSVQLGAILGPFFICPFLTFSGFFLQHKDSPIYLKWLFKVSFLKYSLDGAMLALFGYDRQKLDCNQLYCHYARPKFFLKDLDMSNANYEAAAIFLTSLFFILRIIAFYIMSFRLRLFR